MKTRTKFLLFHLSTLIVILAVCIALALSESGA